MIIARDVFPTHPQMYVTRVYIFIYYVRVRVPIFYVWPQRSEGCNFESHP